MANRQLQTPPEKLGQIGVALKAKINALDPFVTRIVRCHGLLLSISIRYGVGVLVLLTVRGLRLSSIRSWSHS